MKIQVKSSKGDKFELEVDQNKTVIVNFNIR